MLNDHENKILELKTTLMLNKKVLCTGNPSRPYTIASGIKKIYPNATFIHQSNGWNLKDNNQITELKSLFSKHNIFINASYIAPFVQSTLLEICNQSVKFCNVFNIGSTHEYDGEGTPEYIQSKLHLRDLGLKFNSFRFNTHHLILGHIEDQNTQGFYSRISIDTVCETIQWIEQQHFKIPIMAIDNPKKPW